jgi:tetratricopeptide (TPR) repeat protein
LSGRAEIAVQAQAIHGDVHIHAPANPAEAVPRQLPAAVGQFVDRVSEFSALDSLIINQADLSRPVPTLSAVTGGPGVGKTALVVQWAHRVRDRFPDGELYVNLRGYEAGAPVGSAEALDGLLRTLAVPAARIPVDTEAQAGLYRSLLDGRRILIVLDNASSAAQVRPLLPGSASCTVVITSRSRLAGLVARDGARRISLDVLPPAESVKLLREIIGPERVDAEPAAAVELARRCDYLPLALRIAADRVVTHPHGLLGDLVEELSDEQDRLDALTADEDDIAAVRTVFSWSYRALPEQAARAFRLLGLHSGPYISASAAAALLGTTASAARRLLDTLTGAHLLDESARDRYQFHDLVRTYAAEQAMSDEVESERDAAADRVWTWYLHCAANAAQVLPRRHRIQLAREAGARLRPLSFCTHEQALEWCEAERANLVAAVSGAADAGRDEIAWQLALALGSFFNLRKYWNDWIQTYGVGLAAAERIGQVAGQAWLLTGLGSAYRDVGRLDSAIDAQRRAAGLFARIGDAEGIASSRNNLGSVLQRLGHLVQALAEFGAAVEGYRGAGNTQSQGRAMSNHAAVLCDLGRFDEAVAELNEALTLLEASDDRHGEGFTLHNLGDVYTAAQRFEEARQAYLRSLPIRRATGNAWGEARTLYGLGLCHRAMGRVDDAIGALRDAATCYEQTSDTMGHIRALDLLGQAMQEHGDSAGAAEAWTTALEILRTVAADRAVVAEITARLAQVVEKN